MTYFDENVQISACWPCTRAVCDVIGICNVLTVAEVCCVGESTPSATFVKLALVWMVTPIAAALARIDNNCTRNTEKHRERFTLSSARRELPLRKFPVH